MFGKNMIEVSKSIPLYICCRFVLIDVVHHTRLKHAHFHVKSIHVILFCFYRALAPTKKNTR